MSLHPLFLAAIAAIGWMISVSIEASTARKIGAGRAVVVLVLTSMAVEALLIPAQWRATSVAGLGWRVWGWALLAAVVASVATRLSYLALARGTTASVTAVEAAYPMGLVIVAFLRGEPTSWREGLGVGLVVVGVALLGG